MKIDAQKSYKCGKCEQRAFVYSKFWSKYKEEYLAYTNTAVGKCQECGWMGEFSTTNKEKRYEETVS